MRSVDVLVAGAGASGMMAAIIAARGGSRVLVLEKKNRPGKKLLATGNGRCNYTNKVQAAECYRSRCRDKAWEIIRSFDETDTVAWFREIGILPGNRGGYLYPASFQASAVLRALEREMDRLGIEIHREEAVEDISLPSRRRERKAPEKGQEGRAQGGRYIVTGSRGRYIADNVIVSTGGMAAPVHGSTGDGYRLLEPLCLRMEPVYPALCSLTVEGKYAKKWAGNRLQGRVSLTADGQILAEELGEIQLVSQGISGIPVFQVSRYAAQALDEDRRVVLCLDSMPDWEEQDILSELHRRIARDGRQSAGDLLEGMLPDRFSGVLIERSNLKMAERSDGISEKALERLASNIKRLPVNICGTAGFEKAQVTSGGISLDEIDAHTMEVKSCPGLYLTGELLDVDGICGGYNLQWAWSTGYLAGRAASGGKEREK